MIKLCSKFSFLFFLALNLCSCEPLAITNTAIRVEATDLDKVEAIVHSIFLEFGARAGRPTRERQYAIVKLNGSGRPHGNFFYVTYRTESEQIIVHIQNRDVSQEHLKASREYLLDITDKMNDRFKEAGLKATVQTSSYWIPTPSL
ncbi:MAG: hypothetical protein AB2L11_08380 [Syntrophobacteraceae bacterium]